MVHILIRVDKSSTLTAAEAEEFFADLHRQLLSLRFTKGDNQTLSLEMVVYRQFLHFFATMQPPATDAVLGQLYAHFPGIEADSVEDYIWHAPPELSISACSLRLEKKDLYPIKTYRATESDSLVGLSGVFSKIAEDEQLWIKILIKPVKESWHREAMRYLRRTLRITREPEGGTAAMHEKFTKLFFLSHGKLACLAQSQDRANQLLEALVHTFDQFDNDVLNGFEGTYFHSGTLARDWFAQRTLPRNSYHLNTEEIASLYHFPSKTTPIANVVSILSHKAEPPPNLPKAKLGQNPDVSTFALTNFRNRFHPFGIKREDRRRHLHIVGKTGMGKSKLLELLMLSDISAGKGFALLDPHGDLADEVLRFVPKERVTDVVYFNPADEDFPIGFNPLEKTDKIYRQHVVAGFIGIFKKLFAFEWTPRLEHMLRYTTLALLDTEDATVVDIVRLLTNKRYRQDVIAQIHDPVVKNFWTHEFATWNEKYDNEAIVPLLNKVGEFISSPLVRNCVGQPHSTFTIHDVMGHNKILIANLSSGKLGEENSALLGSMLVTQIQQAAMARARLSEHERKDFYLYVDEFQNFATSAFATILSEARKYRLSLTMAHQYIDQLNEELQKTVFGNVGSIIAFRVGSRDAEHLQTELSPAFTAEDLLNLDARHVCLKLSIDGQTASSFSAQTIDLPPPTTDYTPEIIAHSRQTYGRPKDQVEKLLQTWEGNAHLVQNDKTNPVSVAQTKSSPILTDQSPILVFEEPIV